MQYSYRHIQVTSMLNSFFFQLPKLPIICQAASGFSCGMSILIPLLLPLNFIPHRWSSYPSSIHLPFEIPLDLKFVQGFTQLELANCPLISLLSKFRAKKSFQLINSCNDYFQAQSAQVGQRWKINNYSLRARYGISMIQVSSNKRILIFQLADLYHVILGGNVIIVVYIQHTTVITPWLRLI